MLYYITLICGFALMIPAIAGIIRFRRIHHSYYPFIILLWVGVLNECVSWFTSTYYRNTAINSNMYALAEVLLIIWQWYRWRYSLRYTGLSIGIAIGICCIWIGANFLWGKITEFNSYFKIIAASTIVILSISTVSSILTTERRGLAKNAALIISLCFIVLYAYSAAIEIFWMYGHQVGPEWEIPIYSTLNVINVLVSCLFTYAILCMRKKLHFSMPL